MNIIVFWFKCQCIFVTTSPFNKKSPLFHITMWRRTSQLQIKSYLYFVMIWYCSSLRVNWAITQQKKAQHTVPGSLNITKIATLESPKISDGHLCYHDIIPAYIPLATWVHDPVQRTPVCSLNGSNFRCTKLTRDQKIITVNCLRNVSLRKKIIGIRKHVTSAISLTHTTS